MTARRRPRGFNVDAAYVRALGDAEQALITGNRAALARHVKVLGRLEPSVDSTLRKALQARVGRVFKSAPGQPAKERNIRPVEVKVTSTRAKANPKKEYRWFVTDGDRTTHRTHPNTPRSAICGVSVTSVMLEGARGPVKPKWCSGCQREISRMKLNVRVSPAQALPSSKPQSLAAARAALQRRNEQNRAALEADLDGQQKARSVRAIPVNFEGGRRRH